MIYVFLAFSILIAFLFPQGTIRRAMKLISNYWLGVLMYLALTILIADLIRLILIYFVKADQKKFRTPKVFRIVGSICMILILLISFYGVCNARNIRTTSYHVTIHKKVGNHKKTKDHFTCRFSSWIQYWMFSDETDGNESKSAKSRSDRGCRRHF